MPLLIDGGVCRAKGPNLPIVRALHLHLRNSPPKWAQTNSRACTGPLPGPVLLGRAGGAGDGGVGTVNPGHPSSGLRAAVWRGVLSGEVCCWSPTLWAYSLRGPWECGVLCPAESGRPRAWREPCPISSAFQRGIPRGLGVLNLIPAFQSFKKLFVKIGRPNTFY